jgi:uncharacterized membrane protein
MFIYSDFWGAIVKNFEDDLPSPCFFVDNTKGNQHFSIRPLMTAIEEAIAQSHYCQTSYKLSWFRAVDVLLDSKLNVVAYDVAKAMCLEAGLLLDDIDNFLLSMNELGIFMWHNVPGLRNALILDTIKFFLEPATRIICDQRAHITYSNEPSNKQTVRDSYNLGGSNLNLSVTGIASSELVRQLLKGNFNVANYELIVISLMIRYGLAVEWKPLQQQEPRNSAQSPEAIEAETPTMLIFPALFRFRSSDAEDDNDWANGNTVSTIYLVFSLSDFDRKLVLDERDLTSPNVCFMHKGVYDIFLTAILERSQLSPDNNFKAFEITASTAVVQIANVWFRLSSEPSINSLRVEVCSGLMPLVARRLLAIWKEVSHQNRINHKMQLCAEIPRRSQEFVLLKKCASLQARRADLTGALVRAMKGTISQETLAPFVQELQPIFDLQVIAERRITLCEKYDLFVSYRWDNPAVDRHRYYRSDMDRVDDLCDLLEDYCLLDAPLVIFLDRANIDVGDPFRKVFITALLRTTVMVPMMSPLALEKMIAHSPQKVDDLLMEWIAGQLFDKFWRIFRPSRGALEICPIRFSDRTADGVAREFDTGKLDDTVKPVATINKLIDVLEKLEDFDISIDEHPKIKEWLDTLTVSRVVRGLFDNIFEDVAPVYSDPQTPPSTRLAVSAAENSAPTEHTNFSLGEFFSNFFRSSTASSASAKVSTASRSQRSTKLKSGSSDGSDRTPSFLNLFCVDNNRAKEKRKLGLAAHKIFTKVLHKLSPTVGAAK